MTKQDLLDRGFEDFVVFENPSFDDAIIGIDTENKVVYSFKKMIEWLVKKDKMADDEAQEFIEYNTIRSLPYVESSPIVLNDLDF